VTQHKTAVVRAGEEGFVVGWRNAELAAGREKRRGKEAKGMAEQRREAVVDGIGCLPAATKDIHQERM
jgi:hypothetical protein